MNSDYILREIDKLASLLSGLNQKLGFIENLSDDEVKKLFSQEETAVNGLLLDDLFKLSKADFELEIPKLEVNHLKIIVEILELLKQRNSNIYFNLNEKLIYILKFIQANDKVFDLSIANKIKSLE